MRGSTTFCTTTLVLRQLVLQTHRETQRASVTFEARVGTRSGETVLPGGGPDLRATQPARRTTASNPMKHDLTLDQVKQEAGDLLRGFQRRDSEALRRCHAIDTLTDLSNPALDYARFIIAREHGFSSWRKLKEHIEKLHP